VARGRKAKELAAAALTEAGFTAVETDVKYPKLGIEVTFRARDAAGEPWLFDVVGAFSSTRPGLKRADVLFRTLGKAAVVHGAGIGPFVLLSTDRPAAGTPGDRALGAVTGPDRAVHAVVELRDPDAPGQLTRLARGE
jgi:hypothetical protein